MTAIDVEILQRPETALKDIQTFLQLLPYVPRQHDPRWQSVYASLPGESFMAAVARDNQRVVGVSTFCVFQGPWGDIIHGNPYMGYGGCSFAPERSEEIIRAMLSAILAWGKDHHCITATVTMPPFSDRFEKTYESALQPDFYFKNFYQYTTLDKPPLQHLKRKRRSAIMSEIHRAEAAGIKIALAQSIEETSAWLDIYEARYAEIGATTLPRAYLQALWQVFSSSQLHIPRQSCH